MVNFSMIIFLIGMMIQNQIDSKQKKGAGYIYANADRGFVATNLTTSRRMSTTVSPLRIGKVAVAKPTLPPPHLCAGSNATFSQAAGCGGSARTLLF